MKSESPDEFSGMCTVLLNAIADDLAANQPFVFEMLKKAAARLATRHIFLRFGTVVGGKFVTENKYAEMSAQNPEAIELQSFIGSEDSLGLLDIPEKSGIALVEKRDGQVVRILDTFIKTANIKRDGNVSEIKRNIRDLADTAAIEMLGAEELSKLRFLHEIPANFNDDRAAILESLRPFTVLTLRYNWDQTLAYIHMVTQAIGSAA